LKSSSNKCACLCPFRLRSPSAYGKTARALARPSYALREACVVVLGLPTAKCLAKVMRDRRALPGCQPASPTCLLGQGAQGRGRRAAARDRSGVAAQHTQAAPPSAGLGAQLVEGRMRPAAAQPIVISNNTSGLVILPALCSQHTTPHNTPTETARARARARRRLHQRALVRAARAQQHLALVAHLGVHVVVERERGQERATAKPRPPRSSRRGRARARSRARKSH
jgi:hypothetical protein